MPRLLLALPAIVLLCSCDAEPAADVWRYQVGDDPAWAAPDFDDSAWPTQTPWHAPFARERWTDAGRAWFRREIDIDPALAAEPMAIDLRYHGALEIYIDGERVHSIGDLDTTHAGENSPIALEPRGIIPVRFDGAGRHVVAVRMEPNSVPLGRTIGWADGFLMNVGAAQALLDTQQRRRRPGHAIALCAAGAMAAIALLHFLLFVFHRKRTNNAYFALWAALLAVGTFGVYHYGLASHTADAIIGGMAFNSASPFITMAQLMFLYRTFDLDVPRHFAAIVVAGILAFVGMWAGWFPYAAGHALVLIGIAGSSWAVFQGARERRSRFWIIGTGIFLFSCGGSASVFMNPVSFYDPGMWGYVLGTCAFLVSASVYVARDNAENHRELRLRLEKIETLSEERLGLRTAAMGQLVAGIAHEMNTPIGAIQSSGDTQLKAVEKLRGALAKDCPDVLENNRRVRMSIGAIEKGASVIAEGTARVEDIVTRLRSFAKLDEAELQLANVNDCLDDARGMLAHELGGIEVDARYGELPELPCHPKKLNQVFYNLLLNACQAIDGAGTITISTRADGGRVVVDIEDTVGGIDADHLDKIFDPGFTTRGVGVGTGLGLAICYRIVTDHGGKIAVASEPGERTTFTVELPVGEIPSDAVGS